MAGDYFDQMQEELRREREQKGNGKHPPAVIYTADTLKFQEFPPLQPVVPGVIVEGLTLLAGKPKIGKSWMLLHNSIAVARHGFTLGQLQCIEGDVLYCALEDSPRRMKSRFEKLSLDFPVRLHLCHEIPRLVNGGLGIITTWLDQHPQARAVMIDTLQMVRDRDHSDGPIYERDYEALLGLRALANQRHVGIVVSHHLRKAAADDPYDTVSGTLGITGCADSILVLTRAGDGFMLHGKGRDLPDFDKAMRFDRHACTWRILEDAEQRSNPDTIAAALAEYGPMTPAEIALATRIPGATVRATLLRMRKNGTVLEKNGKYQVIDPTDESQA